VQLTNEGNIPSLDLVSFTLAGVIYLLLTFCTQKYNLLAIFIDGAIEEKVL